MCFPSQMVTHWKCYNVTYLQCKANTSIFCSERLLCLAILRAVSFWFLNLENVLYFLRFKPELSLKRELINIGEPIWKHDQVISDDHAFGVIWGRRKHDQVSTPRPSCLTAMKIQWSFSGSMIKIEVCSEAWFFKARLRNNADRHGAEEKFNAKYAVNQNTFGQLTFIVMPLDHAFVTNPQVLVHTASNELCRFNYPAR